MTITDEKGEPIIASGIFGPEFKLNEVDGEPIIKKTRLLELADKEFYLPESLKIVGKVPDKRRKEGFRQFIEHKVVVPKIRTATIGAMKTRGAASLTGETSQIRHNTETKIIPLDVLRIRMMQDPYNFTIRQQFADSVFQDPTIAPSIQKRNKAFYANGYYLDFELKSMINPVTNQQFTPEETEGALAFQRQQYMSYLMELDTWAKLPTIDILDKMKRSHVAVISQGRTLNLIVPKPADLLPGELPISVRNITWENTGQVYVDTIYWQVVGVRLFFINKDMSSPDEMVYITGKNYGLRWLQDYFGASELEPMLQLSRINRKVLWYALAKAAENTLMSKILLQADVQGDQPTRQNQMNNLIKGIINQNSDVIGLEYRATPTIVPVTSDAAMFQFIVDTLDDRLISGAGSTRAQMGRTENLNRDTATIMEVENIRNVRTPDEELIGNAFAVQLFDPLLAVLAGVTIDELPVRVVIKRIEPVDEAVDPDLENKLAELKGASQNKGGDITQDDAGGNGSMEGSKSFGASRNGIYGREYMLTKQGLPRTQVCKILLKEFSTKTIGASGESTEIKVAKMDDVEAWFNFGDQSMIYHWLNPQDWDDGGLTKDMITKKFSALSDEQKQYAIRAFYFRNPSFDISKILTVSLPKDQSAYCWMALKPVMRMHLIDPMEWYDWSKPMVFKDYEELNPEEKEKADKLSKYRHSEHIAGQIPSSIGSSK